ncbi:unnamed protein product, partial [Closterium sp. NIES-53]
SPSSPASAPTSSDPAGKGKGSVEDSGNVTHAEDTASGSGLSLKEKLHSLHAAAPDSGFLEDDSDEELEVDVRTEAFNHVRCTAILLLPVALALEVASVITTVRTLMRRVWSSTLSDGAADSAKFQELLPAYVAKTRYSRLQVSLLREEDIRSIRLREVDYTRKDDLPKELFEAHWDLLGKGFMALAKDFAQTTVLSTEVKEVVTILLHKKGDKDQLNNYRLVTLLNFTYKVLARVMADRMKRFLGRVISPEQYGFLPGRRLTDAVGLVTDIIDTARNDNEGWFLLLVDFKKGFDLVSRGYLFRMMRAMGFPVRFVRWVEGLHEGTQTRLLVNGWMGEGMEVVSGV